MKRNFLSSAQPLYRQVPVALSADLPKALRDLGYDLQDDSYRSWRIPGHGGLIIWQRDDGTWGWNHFGVGEGGDAISFLTEWGGMTRRKAIETLAAYPQACSVQANPPTAKPATSIQETKLPPPAWMKKATKLVARFQRELWEDKDLEVWDWLDARGLKDETIRAARLGWVPEDQWEMREKWGLQELLNDQGNARKMLFPEGLVIPAFHCTGDVIRIRIRRFDSRERPYHTVTGSCMSPLIVGEVGRPIVLVESDLDAWLIHQETGEIVTVSSLGSAGAKPDPILAAFLLAAPQILVGLDNDEPGRKASRKWVETFHQAKLWQVPWGKDPGEAFARAPGLVMEWVELGLTIV